MSYFRSFIKIDNDEIIFSFTGVITPAGTKYFVGAYKNQQNLAFFDIAPDKNGKLVIVPPVADWILKIQDQLFDIIKEYS